MCVTFFLRSTASRDQVLKRSMGPGRKANVVTSFIIQGTWLRSPMALIASSRPLKTACEAFTCCPI